jgi:putative ABC transport system permease protein
VTTPRLITFLLRRVLPKTERELVLGDLEEEYLTALPRLGRPAARRWFRREGFSLLAAYTLARLRRGGTRDLSVVLEARGFAQRSGRRRTGERPSDSWAEALLQDVRSALRTLRREPRYLITVVLTLAIGIGANTALFSVLNGVVLKPLAYREPDRLVSLYTAPVSDPGECEYWCGLDFIDIRQQSASFEQLACCYDYSQTGFDLTGGDQPRRIFALPVSSGYFEVLGVAPLLGRTFRREEERYDNNDVLISYRLWQDYFGGDRRALGESLILDGTSFPVIGVLPPDIQDPFGRSLDVWLVQNLVPGSVPPGSRSSQNSRDNYYLSVIGRLRPEVSPQAAETELAALAAAIDQENPSTNRDPWQVTVIPLNEAVIGPAGRMILILFGAVALVLLIAAVNIVNLTLTHQIGRERELALRSALGAGRPRLVRQLLAESLVAALLGGGLGFLFAREGVRLLLAVRPDALPRVEAVTFDPAIFAFTAAVSIAVGIFCGLIPALRITRSDLARSLRESGRSASTGLRQRRLQRALVISQVGLAVVLLSGAGLLVQSFARLIRIDPGVQTEQVLTFDLSLPDATYPVVDPSHRLEFYRRFHERLAGLPGVRAAGAVSRLPLTGDYHRWSYRIRKESEGSSKPIWHLANIRMVQDDYFEAMGIELLRGRFFSREDGPTSPPVTIISRTLAERYFPDSDPIEEQIWRDGWRKIVGIVEDVRVGYREEIPEQLYMPYADYASDRPWVLAHVVASDSELGGLTEAVRSELAALDPELIPFNVQTMERVAGRALARDRFALFLMTAFAGVALSLALVGIYGVLAYSVSRRTREIGIRMALGAQDRDVRRAVVREGMTMTAAGIGLGLALALAMARMMSALVYEVSVTDPLTFLGVVLLLSLAAGLTCLVPARRATRTDPIEVLRRA